MTWKDEPVNDEEKKMLGVLATLEGYTNPFLSSSDALALYREARKLPPGAVVVEIGSFKGKSTICMVLGFRDSGNDTAQVYAVDPFEGQVWTKVNVGDTYAAFQRNVKKVGMQKSIVPLRMTSEAAAKQWDGKPIHLLWIDGLHESPFPVQDIRAWKPFLLVGGKLFMDDFYFRDVKSAFKKEIADSPEFSNIHLYRYLASATKAPSGPGGQLLKKICYYHGCFLDWLAACLSHVALA